MNGCIGETLSERSNIWISGEGKGGPVPSNQASIKWLDLKGISKKHPVEVNYFSFSFGDRI